MPIPILMYHQIAEPAARGSPFRSLTVHPKDFRRQMQWLKRMGFNGLSMRNLKPYLCGEKSGKVVGITFDDGFRNVHANALPVLQDLDFTATNYFVSRQIGGFNEWDAAIGVPYSACMDKPQMLEWAALGHEVGAHTLDHVHLTAVPTAIAQQQITDVRQELEDILGNVVDAFCYPYGDVSGDVRNMVAEAGYSSATTTCRGRARPEDDILLLPRRIVRCTDSWPSVLYKCVSA